MKIVREVVVTLALAAGVFFGAKVWLGRHDAAVREGAANEALDKEQLRDLARYSIVVDSMRTLADSEAQRVRDSAAVVVKAVDHDVAAMKAIPRLTLVAAPLTPSASDSLVSVYVESDSMAYPAHPRLARILVEDDSLIHEVAIPRFAQMQSTVLRQNAVILQLHAVVDSAANLILAHQVRETTLEQRLASTKPSKKRQVAEWVFRGLAAYGGYRVGKAAR